MNPKHARVIFMGTPDFAVESLKALVEGGYNIVGVITAPDKPAGRGQKLAEPAVKKYAIAAGLPVLQPEKLKNPAFLEQLNALKPDLQVVVAFRMLPQVVWNLPPLGTFNLHGSLLPQYRGAAPLNWAIINGETETGVTTFLLSHEIDTGKILLSQKIAIDPNDTVGDIHDRLMMVGANLVLKTVDALAEGTAKAIPQENLAVNLDSIKPAPKIFRDNMHINWMQPLEIIRNLIRGLSPFPTAWTNLISIKTGQSMELKIFFAESDTLGDTIPGTIKSDGKTYLKIACTGGWLRITDLQLAGKRRMPTNEFLRGFQYPENYRAE